MDVKQIRVENLRRLLKERSGGNQRKFADDYGLSKAHISQMMTRHRDMGDKKARDIEKLLKLERGFMDAQHDEFPRDTEKLTPDEIILLAAYRAASLGHKMAVHNLLNALLRGGARDSTNETNWKGEDRRSSEFDN